MKKLSTLHILNGDASLPNFTKANLPGQVLVWREVLSEGPVHADLPESEFWQKREEYITRATKEPAEAYHIKVLEEVQKLEQAHTFFEVILWFDADLMCQVNLLFLLSRLQQRRPAMVSVCTPGPGSSIGLLNSGQLQALMEKRQQLTQDQLYSAGEIWELYASPHPLKLQLYLQQISSPLPHLDEAMHLFFTRFPDCTDGLSQPERALLQFIQDGATNMNALMQQFWIEYPGYGFGDLQLEQLLSQLQPDLAQTTEPLKLSFFGERVLQGYANYKPKPYWLGGTEINGNSRFCYDQETKKLKPCA
ncbi:DUF1835 domain-containing protein [Pontibacter oryzae]|uniref:DUF1835 domain-containing protein n=1 Tax=Pontibacter oryzae TaxID=2304593 RepID=A0A399SJN7_9BACT|nr:DUF1835 domain-containing protein [Pontibacter oryzae]RIJ42362.1 DUF1835 domain-containing protein [Pontibacter oryzae]